MKKNQFSLIFSALKMAIATFSSRILGLIREQVMAAYFGASGITDAFTIAYRVPHALRDLFAEGSFSSAFVPVFTETRIKDYDTARRLLWSMVVLLGTVTSIVSILIIIFAGPIVSMITNDQFTTDPERTLITIQLVRVMAPFLVLISLSALFMGVLNSIKIFFVPALAPAFFNIVMIVSMVFLPSVVEGYGFHPVFSMGVGVVGGGLIQLLIQLPLIFKNHYGPKGPLVLFDENTKKISSRLGIGTIGVATTQINVLVSTVLATGTQLGAVSWLSYAFRLFQFPVGILSVSIAGSNLVHFSEAWKKNNRDEAIETLRSSYLFSWFSVTPAFALMFALSSETVNLIFERGAFNSQDTMMSALALKYYLVGLPFYALYKIFAPTFFALDKPKIPVLISIVCVIFNIIFSLLLVPRFGFKVLALGTSFAMMLNCLLQVFFLRKEMGIGRRFFFDFRIFKTIIAGVICFAVTQWLGQAFYEETLNTLEKCYVYGGCVMAGSLCYLLALIVTGEGRILKNVLNRRKS